MSLYTIDDICAIKKLSDIEFLTCSENSGICKFTSEKRGVRVIYIGILNNNRIVTASHNSSLRLWDPISNEYKIISLHVLPDNKVVRGSDGWYPKVYNPYTGLCDFILNDRVCCMKTLPDGRLVVANKTKITIFIYL